MKMATTKAGDIITKQINLCLSGDIKGKIDFGDYLFSSLATPLNAIAANVVGVQLVNYTICESATSRPKRSGTFTIKDGTFNKVSGVKGCFAYANAQMALRVYTRTTTLEMIERKADITDLELIVSVEFTVDKDYGSLVKNNLMKEKFYTPYCGSDNCSYGIPRTKWFGGQFMCSCGWKSDFDATFIQEYRKKWNK